MARARPRLAITALLVASLSLTATAAFNRFDITLPDKCTGGPCAWEHIYRGYAAWHNATTRDPFACGGAKVDALFLSLLHKYRLHVLCM